MGEGRDSRLGEEGCQRVAQRRRLRPRNAPVSHRLQDRREARPVKKPAAGDPMSLELPPLQKATLSNGLKMVLAERHTAPVVNFTLLVDSGYSADAADTTSTAHFTQHMLEEGTPTPRLR